MIPLEKIGYIARSIGLTGSIRVALTQKINNFSKPPKFVFLEENPQPVPFLLLESELRNESLWIIKLADINSPEEVLTWKDCSVFLHQDDMENLVELEENTAFSGLSGFVLYDQAGAIVGNVNEILEMPGHDLLSVDYNGKEALIPVNEFTVLEIDRKKKRIQVAIPDGLLDIF